MNGVVISETVRRHLTSVGYVCYLVFIAIVELEEGPRLVTNIVGTSNDKLHVGMPVVVQFEQYDDVAIPKFRPAE